MSKLIETYEDDFGERLIILEFRDGLRPYEFVTKGSLEEEAVGINSRCTRPKLLAIKRLIERALLLESMT